MATFTKTFYPLKGSPSGSTDIKPGLWWSYEKTDSGYSRNGAGSSSDLKKVETFTLTDLPSGVKINSITVEWFTTATRNNSNIYSPYYGWGKGIVYAGTVVDSKAIKGTSESSSSNTSWGQGKMVIPSDRINEYYNSDTQTLSCLFHYGISYPPKSPTSLSGLGQVANRNETICYWWDIKITVDYTFPYTTLSTPSVTTETVKIIYNDTTKLQWGASSNLTGGSNTVNGYSIYRNGQEIATVDENTTEYTIKYDKDSYSDKEYYYQVRANSSKPGYESALSNRLIVQFCKKISPPPLTLYTDKNNAQATDIYIGKEGQPRITIAWGSLKSFGGKYDSIAEISLSNIEGSISTSNTSFTLPESTVLNETTEYKLSIKMSSTQTTEATVTVHVLEVGEVNFTSISSNGINISLDPNDLLEKITGPNIKLEWNALEKIDGINGIKYILEINDSEGGNFSVNTEQSLEELNIKSYIKNGEEYTCSITPKVEATYGGYSLGNPDTIALKRMAGLTVSDNDITFSTDTESKGYSWQKVIMEVEKKERYKTVIFCYKRSGEKDTSLQKNSYEFGENETLSYTHQLIGSEYPNGTEIEYSIIIKDEYGEEVTKTKKITRYKVPEIEIEQIEQDSAAEGAEEVHIQFKAKDEYANPNGETGFCSIFMGYKGQWVQLQNSEGSKFSCNIVPNISTSNIIQNLSVSYSSFGDVLTTLAQELKDFTVSIPKIEFKIRVWNSDIWNAESIKEYENEELPYAEEIFEDPISINYRREITNLTLTCEGYTEDENEEGKHYFSSGEVLTFTVGASFLRIDGEEAKDELTYKITKNNDIIIKDNKDVLEDINSDTTYSYTVTATTPYKDGSTEESKKISINVRRYLAPTISVSNLVLDDTEGLSGTIDYTINGSDKISPNGNIKSIIIIFEGEGIERKEVEPSIIDSGKYPFKISTQEQKTQVTVTFTIKTVSKGNVEKTAYYGPVLIKSMGIPFAIRKEGIGVHAPKDFNPGHEDAALKVVGNSDTNTIAEFANNSNRQGSNISLNLNDTKVYLSLQIDEENGEPYFAVLFDK